MPSNDVAYIVAYIPWLFSSLRIAKHRRPMQAAYMLSAGTGSALYDGDDPCGSRAPRLADLDGTSYAKLRIIFSNCCPLREVPKHHSLRDCVSVLSRNGNVINI